MAALKSIADMASRTATSDVRADVRPAARYIKRAIKGRLLTLDDMADPTSSMAPDSDMPYDHGAEEGDRKGAHQERPPRCAPSPTSAKGSRKAGTSGP